MTDISARSDLVAPVPQPSSGLPKHTRAILVGDAVAFAGALAVASVSASSSHWQIVELGLLIALAMAGELTGVFLPSRKVAISASFLAVTLATVLLGPAPGMVVGVSTTVAGWIRWRERGDLFAHNLVMFAWPPLITGLAFRAAAGAAQVDLHHAGFATNPSYYLLVFGAFFFALGLGLLVLAVYSSLMAATSTAWASFRDALIQFKPVMSAELSSAALTVVAAYMTNELRIAGLALFAIVLIVFQYLVRELLISQARGEELQRRAVVDTLTGLPNRKAFDEAVDALIAELEETGQYETFAVLLLDFDHFKDVNDTLGHQYGDDLLKIVGPRLAARVGKEGMVARFGGDEFGILPAVKTDNVASMKAICEDVLASVREPVVFDEITLQVDASIGVARYPSDGTNAQTLLRRADVAMYSAKDQREGHRFYTSGQDHHSVSRLSLVGDFRRALDLDDQIVVYFQPIVDIRSKQVHGAEALVRWQHPRAGLLQPAAFLEMVEQTGLIGAMTETVVDRAIAECAAWRAAGRDLRVAVNLSARNLHDPMLSSQVLQMLDLHRLPADALTLEITETMILADPQRALITVESLSEMGVHFSVDDFGTGYSSLANLRMLPVHELKVDRSFVTPMLNEESDGVIVRSTVELGHALGLTVVAEGVETETTLQRLEEIGCDRAQGYLLSRPMPPIEFMRWINSYEATVSSAA